ncbi:MAG: SMC-Scp complex subunit ScpB [Firmicutes bacterium]|nr:SMC-Scp complex subunit ScpB [Bacillota bacterium]
MEAETETLTENRTATVDWLPALEGVLFAAGTEGLTDRQIANVFDLEERQVPYVCHQLVERQEKSGSMLRVARLADTWQLVTHPSLAPYLRALALAPPAAALSGAALETLAIIAYKQPITRAMVEEIRGVKSERPLGTLVARGLIAEVGRAEGPGRPYLYGTTKEFMDYFGIANARELPPLPLGE